MKKIGVLALFALFISATAATGVMATYSQNYEGEQKDFMQKKIINNKENEKTLIENPTMFQARLQTVISKIETKPLDFIGLLDLLEWLFENSDYKIITFLLSNLFNTNRLRNREIVLSMGWNYNFNPLKKNEIKMVKPLALWGYVDTPELTKMPSMTVLISGDPLKIETISGRQIGFMYRFRGFYGHIPKQFPQQSMTYMIGTAENAAALEIPGRSILNR